MMLDNGRSRCVEECVFLWYGIAGIVVAGHDLERFRDLLLNAASDGPDVLPSEAGDRIIGVVPYFVETGGAFIVEPAGVDTNPCVLRGRNARSHRYDLRKIHLKVQGVRGIGQVFT